MSDNKKPRGTLPRYVFLLRLLGLLASEIKASTIKGYIFIAGFGALIWFALVLRGELVKNITPVLDKLPFINTAPDSLGALEFTIITVIALIIGTTFRYRKIVLLLPIKGFFKMMDKILSLFDIEWQLGDKIIITSSKRVERWTPAEIQDTAHGRSKNVFVIGPDTYHFHHTKKAYDQADNKEKFCKENGCIERYKIFELGGWPTLFIGKLAFVIKDRASFYDKKETGWKEVGQTHMNFGEPELNPYARADQDPPSWMLPDPTEKLLAQIQELIGDNAALMEEVRKNQKRTE